MQIQISGKFTPDVQKSGLQFTNELRDRLKAFDLSVVAANLDSLVYFPVILAEWAQVPAKSHRSFSNKERAEFVNIEIPHGDWVSADDASKRRLLLDGLKRAIEETSEGKLPSDSKRLLIDNIAGE